MKMKVTGLTTKDVGEHVEELGLSYLAERIKRMKN
jgi:hypothetical protein